MLGGRIRGPPASYSRLHKSVKTRFYFHPTRADADHAEVQHCVLGYCTKTISSTGGDA
jgi:hypothetical protein